MSVLYKIAASPLSLLAEGVFLGIAVYLALTGRGGLVSLNGNEDRERPYLTLPADSVSILSVKGAATGLGPVAGSWTRVFLLPLGSSIWSLKFQKHTKRNPKEPLHSPNIPLLSSPNSHIFLIFRSILNSAGVVSSSIRC